MIPFIAVDHCRGAEVLKEIGVTSILVNLAALVRPVQTGAMTLYPLTQVADILSVSKRVVKEWEKNGKLTPRRRALPADRAFCGGGDQTES